MIRKAIAIGAFFIAMLMSANSASADTLRDDVKQKAELNYDIVYSSSESGFYEVKKNDKWGLIDANGREVLPCLYDNIYFDDDCGGYFEVKKDGKMAIFDAKLKMQLDFKYSKVYWYQRDDYDGCDVELNGKKGYINRKCKLIIPCEYDDVSYFPDEPDEIYAGVSIDGKKGMFNVKTQSLVIPCEYDNVIFYPDKPEDVHAEVVLGGRSGVFNVKTQSLVIPCEYDEVLSFQLNDSDYKKGRAQVQRSGLCGVYDTKINKEIIPCEYTKIFFAENGMDGTYLILALGGEFVPFMSKYENESGVDTGNYFETPAKWGAFNADKGELAVPCEYEFIDYIGEGMFKFNVGGTFKKEYASQPEPQGGLWGIVDANGKVICNAECQSIDRFKDGVASVVKNGVASFVVNPNAGTKLLLANGVSSCAIDNNIPTIERENEDTFAFIFANENYLHFSGADFAINDGKVFSKYCKQTLGLSEHNVRYFEDATYGNIQSALKKIQDIADVYDGDAKIIFYFSGLGNTEGDLRYILPSDASPTAIATTGISVNNVLGILNGLNTKYTLALFDAPFNGADRSGKMLASSRSIKIKSKVPAPSGNTIALFGSSDDKNNYCNEKNGHGLLTYFILEHLQTTKGDCTIQSLIDETKKNVERESLKLFKDVQVPQLVVPANIQQNVTSIKL